MERSEIRDGLCSGIAGSRVSRSLSSGRPRRAGPVGSTRLRNSVTASIPDHLSAATNPELDTLGRIAAALGANPRDLFEE